MKVLRDGLLALISPDGVSAGVTVHSATVSTAAVELVIPLLLCVAKWPEKKNLLCHEYSFLLLFFLFAVLFCSGYCDAGAGFI